MPASGVLDWGGNVGKALLGYVARGITSKRDASPDLSLEDTMNHAKKSSHVCILGLQVRTQIIHHVKLPFTCACGPLTVLIIDKI